MKTDLQVPHVAQTIPGPRAKEIITKFEAYKTPSLSVHPPLVFKRANGAIVEDVDDNTFIDLTSGIAVTNLGHSRPEVVKAVQQQAAELMNCYDHPTAVRAQLHEALAELVPTNCEGEQNRVQIVSTGSEANEFCLKLSRRYSKKFEIITTRGGFHGRGTIHAMALTDDIKYRRGYGAMPPGVLHAPYAYCYRCPYGASYPACDLICADEFEQVIRYESAGDIAAFIVEPVQGASGYIPAPDAYLQRISEFCKKYGILLIADEIHTGFGRTGKMFAMEYSGVKADIMAVGKGLGGGLPIAAVIARESIMNQMSPGDHSTTYGGNPLSCAGALANVKVFNNNPDILEHVCRISDQVMTRLKEMQKTHRLIGDVRGKGLMIGVELVKDRQTKEPATEEMKLIRKKLYQKGVIMVTAGLWGSVLRIAPPLTIEAALMNKALDILEAVLSEVE